MNKREFLSLLGSAIVAVPVAMTVGKVGGQEGAGDKASPADDLWEKIKARGELRAAYIPYAPTFMVDVASGQRSGIFHDAMAAICADLGLKLTWSEEVTFATLFEGFKTGRYDVVGSGIWVNAPRTRQGDFSQPLYYSGMAAYTRANANNVPDDISLLNDAQWRISTIDGEMASVIAAQHFPKAETVSLPNTAGIDQMLQDVLARKADIALVEDEAANRFMQSHPGSLRRLHTMMAVPNVVVVPAGQEALKAALNHNFALLQTSGRLSQVLKKYETVSGTLLRLATPYTEARG